MEEGELLLGTVEKVSNNITLVRLENGKEGTIISSEIAPGRIKHMRQYVVPNKKIVVKVLEISGDHIHLSLRRVNSKEKKEVMQKFKQEQATKVAFNQILGEDSTEQEKILEDYSSLQEFANAAKKDNSLLEKYIPKDSIEKLKKVIDKKRKKSELKSKVELQCLESNGVQRIKEVFKLNNENTKVTYVSAGKFSLSLEVEDFKQGKKEMQEIENQLRKNAKKNSCEITITEERQ